MNIPQYNHPSNQNHQLQNLRYTNDQQLKPFKLSQIFKKSSSIQSLNDQQLVQFCHQSWKSWMTNLLELKQLIEKQNNQNNRKVLQQKKNNLLPNKNQNLLMYQSPNNPNMQPHAQPMFWPPFYPASIQNMNRPPPNMPYMRNNQHLPPFVPQNIGRGSFPFPFNPQQIKLNEGNQHQIPNYNQNNMMSNRSHIMGQPGMNQQNEQQIRQEQSHSNEAKN